MATVMEVAIHFSGIKRQWADRCADWWVNLQLISWPQVPAVSQKFCDLFDAVYGANAVSAKRLFSSAISSLTSVVVIYYLLVAILPVDYSESFILLGPFGSQVFTSSHIDIYSLKHLYLLLYCAVMVNIVPDMISLFETGFILRFSRNGGVNTFMLFIVDLALTTLIWIAWNIYLMHFDPVVAQWAESNSLWSLYSFDSSPLWITFAISTYATSLLWFAFVSIIVAIGSCKRASRRLVSIIESPVVAQLPITLIVGVPCLVAWPILCIIRLAFC
ncbi:MAG: hypothetical protein V2B20_00410 [Pseudomonadota bacterium]